MAILQKIGPFSNVVAGGVAVLRVPRYKMTLTRLVLGLGGTTFTRSHIADIKVKLGVRTVYQVAASAGKQGGDILDIINSYKGIQNNSKFLTLDFTERDAPDIIGKEIAGYDMAVLPDEITVEVTILGTAVAPTLEATAFLTPSQGDKAGGYINKVLYVPSASGGASGKWPVLINPMGALVKRVFFCYAGADWGASANGNLNRLEVKKSGLVVWDMSCLDARFVQSEYRKVPQSKVYVYDPIVDNNQSAALVTVDATALEFNTYLTASDTLAAYVELIDKPYNA